MVVELELGQTDGHHKRLLLSLRTEFLQGMPVEGELQIVFVDAHVGIPRVAVLLYVFLQKILQRLLVQARLIDNIDPLRTARYDFVVMLKDRQEGFQKKATLLMNVIGMLA